MHPLHNIVIFITSRLSWQLVIRLPPPGVNKEEQQFPDNNKFPRGNLTYVPGDDDFIDSSPQHTLRERMELRLFLGLVRRTPHLIAARKALLLPHLYLLPATYSEILRPKTVPNIV